VEALIAGLSRHHGPHGLLAATWPTGSMVLWAVLLLGACLVFYTCSADRTRVRALGARYMGERLYRVELPDGRQFFPKRLLN
jgi:hypothetical protein